MLYACNKVEQPAIRRWFIYSPDNCSQEQRDQFFRQVDSDTVPWL